MHEHIAMSRSQAHRLASDWRVNAALRAAFWAALRADANGVAVFELDELRQLLGRFDEPVISARSAEQAVKAAVRREYAEPGSTPDRIVIDTDKVWRARR